MIRTWIILEFLDKQLPQLRADLKADWWEFKDKLLVIVEAQNGVLDKNRLQLALDQIWHLCGRYPVVETALANDLKVRFRRPVAPNRPDEIPILETVNHFQSLLDRLKEMPEIKEDHPQTPQANRAAGKPVTYDR
jgi:hypothetical protein